MSNLRVYISTRSARAEEARGVARRVVDEAGAMVVSRWILPEARLLTEVALATVCLEDLCRANTLLSLGDSGGRGGRHAEFGFALGRSYRILVVGAREHVLHRLPSAMIRHFDDVDAAIRDMARLNRKV